MPERRSQLSVAGVGGSVATGALPESAGGTGGTDGAGGDGTGGDDAPADPGY